MSTSLLESSPYQGNAHHRAAVVALWLGTVLLAGFFSVLVQDSAYVDGVYIPRTNDSLYHARRILDVAVGEAEFYQFEPRLHVPEGTWIPWPWGYDYLLAKTAQLALWIDPDLHPLGFLSYVAVGWLSVNAALVLAASGALGLSLAMRFIVMLCFALSPLTQILHAVGQIDHHFIELTFVLLNIWIGLKWFAAPERLLWPIALGSVLGASLAFHNGLFILQLMPLTCIFVLWLRNAAPPGKPLIAFSIALLIVTLLVLVPSEPFRHGMFEFGLLSVFHLYASFSTAAAVVFMAYRPVSIRTVSGLGVLVLILVTPMVAEALRGASFIVGDFSILSMVEEAQSPYVLITETLGLKATISYYSWLLLLAPALAFWAAYRACTERRPLWVFYGITSALGLVLLMLQFRFHYFGMFALITFLWIELQRVQDKYRWHEGIVFVLMFATVVALYQPPLRERLFVVHPAGSDAGYANAWTLFQGLEEQCATDPGVVLAHNDDGNAVLFHSDCSVIANNFILRGQDDAKLNEVGQLMLSTPEAIRAVRPDIKYLLLRAASFSTNGELDQRFPLAKSLLVDDHPPEGYELIGTVTQASETSGSEGVYARLYKIHRD